jgi:hypothetical protein
MFQPVQLKRSLFHPHWQDLMQLPMFGTQSQDFNNFFLTSNCSQVPTKSVDSRDELVTCFAWPEVQTAMVDGTCDWYAGRPEK